MTQPSEIPSPERYGRVAMLLHWAAAGSILALLGSGFVAADSADPATKAAILRLHLPLGVAVLLLTLARLAWAVREARRGARPEPLPGTPRWQHAAARVTHVLLYVIPIGMAASGIGLAVLSEAGLAVFGGGVLPDFSAFAPRIPHGIGARLLVLLLLLHIAAALHHHFIRRDGLLRRMWPAGGTTRAAG